MFSLLLVIKVLGFLLLLYVLIGMVLYLLQERFIFFPTKLKADFDFTHLPDHEEIWLANEETNTLHGLYFKSSLDKGLVLFFHGNAGALDKWGHASTAYLELGYSVFMIDYRGYGKSLGTISEVGLKEDVLQAYNWAISRYSKDRLILCGRSLGTGLATWLSSKKPSTLLLLETPYTSLIDMARLTLNLFPLEQLMRYQLNNVDLVAESMAPVYIIHGTDDELIPLKMAQAVAKQKGELFTLKGASHNDLANFAEYHESLQNIFSAHG